MGLKTKPHEVQGSRLIHLMPIFPKIVSFLKLDITTLPHLNLISSLQSLIATFQAPGGTG